MGWFEMLYPQILIVRKIFAQKEKEKPVPPSCGSDASPQEKSNSEEMGEKRKQKEKQQKAADGLKLVVNTAKIQCPLCLPPLGTLMVTDPNPTAGDKPIATETDKGKPNLMFTGMCSKSPWSSTPCTALIQPGIWQDTGSLKVQEKAPLLFKSTTKCLYGGTDIKFINSGQLKPPIAYDAPGPKREEKTEETINIRISVFFDGTANNRINTQCRLEYNKKIKKEPYEHDSVAVDEELAAIYETKVNEYAKAKKIGLSYKTEEEEETEDDSYENDYSNVAKLFKFYHEEKVNKKERWGCVYVEGVGTTDKLDDDTIPQGLGMGLGFGTGVFNRVQKGCEQTVTRIKVLAKGRKIDTLTIDVIGFSRGAASARTFLNEITIEGRPAYKIYSDNGIMPIDVPEKPKGGEMGRLLKDKNIKYDELKIKFAGLFDTVASYGLFKSDNVFILSQKAVKKARTVLHLTAIDERRTNFPLINIASKSLASEKELPGVHSDVGGGYNPIVNESVSAVFLGSIYDTDDEKRNLVNDGWYTNHKLEEKPFSALAFIKSIVNPRNLISPTLGQSSLLKGWRTNIRNEYSFIPLQIMCTAAMNKPVYMDLVKEDLEAKFKIPEKLTYVKNRLNDYVFHNGHPMKFYTREELVKEISMEREKIRKDQEKERIRIEKEQALKAHNKEMTRKLTNAEMAQETQKSFVPVSTSMVSYIDHLHPKGLNITPAKEFPTGPTSAERLAEENRKFAAPVSTATKQPVSPTLPKLITNELNASEFSTTNPELARRIDDHNHLLELRSHYLHVSHKCGYLKALSFIVSYMDPYSPSIRAAKIRKHYDG